MPTTQDRIAPSVLRDQLDEVNLVDVRTPGEFETARLPEARNRPLDELDHSKLPYNRPRSTSA